MYWPEKVFLFYIFLAVSLVGFGVIKLVTNPERDDEKIATIILGFCSIGGAILAVLKVIFVFFEKANKTGQLGKCIFNRAVGFFVITLCGFFPRIMKIFVIKEGGHLDYFFATTPLILANVSYFLFVVGTHKYCTWDKTICKNITKWNISIQAVILIFSILLCRTSFIENSHHGFYNSQGHYKSEYHRHVRILSDYQIAIQYIFQIVFAGMCLAGIQEIFVIYKGALKLKDAGNLETVRVDSNEMDPKKEASRPECKICMTPYSEPSRIPRILKECGHTVCEKCAGELLKDGKLIFCPLCQTVTVVNGPASTLPKNYETMDAMDSMKN